MFMGWNQLMESKSWRGRNVYRVKPLNGIQILPWAKRLWGETMQLMEPKSSPFEILPRMLTIHRTDIWTEYTPEEKTSFVCQWMTNHLPTRWNIKGRFIYNTYNHLNIGYWFVRFRGHRISAKCQTRNTWLLIILLEPNNNYTEDWRHTITDDGR